VGEINDGDYLVYNNVSGLENKSIIQIKASDVGNATIELRENDPVGKVLAIYSLSEENNKCPDEFEFDLPALKNIQNLCFVFKGEGKNLLEFDAFSFR
jgi:phosphoribosyl-dephospho-CoA transferase